MTEIFPHSSLQYGLSSVKMDVEHQEMTIFKSCLKVTVGFSVRTSIGAIPAHEYALIYTSVQYVK